jgi:16S rRNA (guanine966-N2)-methyltransferase
MRIISGAFKGRKLAALPGFATRPTTDRVRESIFNIIAADIENARVLDLFAGTGALGLEALSRGAASAVFIDASDAAIKIICKNIAACRAEAQCRVIRRDIRKNLNFLDPENGTFDLVFMDPPYGQNLILPALENLMKKDVMKNPATIIIEHSAREPIPENLPGLHLADRRAYGKTLVSFLTVVLQEKFHCI